MLIEVIMAVVTVEGCALCVYVPVHCSPSVKWCGKEYAGIESGLQSLDLP